MVLLGKEKISIIVIFLYLFIISCKHTKNTDSIVSPELKVVIVPKFNSDSAYSYIEKQVAFGPRVPNSRAHSQCFNYLVQSLENCGSDVITQIDNIKRYE